MKENTNKEKYKILFISPYQSHKNIGWQKIQLSTLAKYCVAYAHNNVQEKGNLYNLNSTLNKIARKFNERINEKYLYPKKLLQIKKEQNYDFIACNFVDFAIKFRYFIQKHEVPFLVFCHGRDIMWDYINPKTGQKQYNSDFYKKLDKVKDRAYFIANSSFTMSQLEKVGISSERIFIKYFGLDTKETSNRKDDGETLNLLFIGRLIACKGPLETIKSFIIAKENGFKGSLTVVGSGALEVECGELALTSKFSDQILMLGSKPHCEVLKLLSYNDVIVAHQKKDPKTNQEEALGISLIEGLSFGLPIVTSASGGVCDIVEDRYNGFIVSQGDCNSQAQKFLELEQNNELYNQMSKNAFETVKRKFSKESDEQNLISILEAIRSKPVNSR